MATCYSLFSSPVISDIIDVDTTQLQFDMERKDIINFEKIKHDGYSNVSEISKDLRILERYSNLKEVLLSKWYDAASNLFNYNNDYKITTSWITRTKKETSSTMHLHKNSFYSGVFYYGKYSDKSGGIQFSNPIEQFIDYYLEPHTPNLLSSNTHTFYPKNNLLLFFPSYLKHRIMCHKDNSYRYSLAFNIAPTGLYGIGDSQYNSEWLT